MKPIALITLIFLAIAPAAIAAPLGDEALASFIEGRVDGVLNDGEQIAQSCDQNGCAVIVQ